MLRRYLDQTTYMVCAKIDSKIAGISIWSPPEDFKMSSPLHLRMLRLIVSVYDTLSSYLYPEWLQKQINPTEYEATRSRIEGREAIMAVDDDLKRIALANGPKEGSYWTLAVLGVSEEYGRRGIGTKLLHWGFEEADKTDRAIFVSASEEGTALYIKSGFEVLYKAPQVVYDPVRGWVNQTYLIRWQKSKRKADI